MTQFRKEQANELIDKQLDARTYTVCGTCSNCGHNATITIPFGTPRNTKTTCANCGCYTMLTRPVAPHAFGKAN